MSYKIKEDMKLQKCVIHCYNTIKEHILKFYNRDIEDKELRHILWQIIDKFERNDK